MARVAARAIVFLIKGATEWYERTEVARRAQEEFARVRY